MTATGYTIEQNATCVVLKDGNIVAHGFPSVDMALHGIWVLEGHDACKVYHEQDGVILLEDIKKEEEEICK